VFGGIQKPIQQQLMPDWPETGGEVVLPEAEAGISRFFFRFWILGPVWAIRMKIHF